MINVRKNSGITLIALIVMVIVIGIIAGISLTQGTELLKSSNVEGYVTNMITTNTALAFVLSLFIV